MPFHYIKHIPQLYHLHQHRDLPDILEIVVVSSEDEATEDFEGHLEEEDDPE